jgi:hypothetical protein
MSQIEVETSPLNESLADFLWVLHERNFYKGIQSEDKLDGVITGNKRTEETA